MQECVKCGRLIAGQTIGLNQKFLGRHTKNFMCIDCLADFLGTTRETLFDRIRDFIEIEKCELFETEEFENTREALLKAQKLPLNEKIKITCERVTEWYYFYRGKVSVSFSGGKDSTVLLNIVRSLFPDVEAVFVNTGLEYPEIQMFVKKFANVTIIRPEMRFDEVIKKYGYPIIGKRQADAIDLGRKNIKDNKYSFRLLTLGITPEEAQKMNLQLPEKQMLDRYAATKSGSKFNSPKYKPLLFTDFKASAKCCNIMKKKPLNEYYKKTGKVPIVATMTCESMLREAQWIQNGCNAFDAKHPKSAPMSFWTEQDVLKYIKQYNVSIASVYGKVVYAEDPEQMRIEEYFNEYSETEKLTTTGCDRTGCIFCAFGCHRDAAPSRFQRLKETHPRQYEYCINGGRYVWEGTVLMSDGTTRELPFINDDGSLMTTTEQEKFIEENKNNPHFKFEQVWEPNGGLGMGYIFKELNKIYGDEFIKY